MQSPASGMAISARSLRKTYRLSKKQQKLDRTSDKIKVAVSDLSFDVAPGEVYGLLGPNGAGKTTTLRMLAGLIRPDSGDAYVNGYSVITESTSVRASIGFLTSELKLEEVFSPSYLFDFFASLHDIDRETAVARKNELFERFGIGHFAETKIGDLSTGMKQKASLAISVAHNPSIVIFDEPTNGLDIITAKTVTDFISSLREEGTTVILSTHIFSLVEKVCDRVGIILDGSMAAEGSLAELTSEKDLETLFFDIYSELKGEAA